MMSVREILFDFVGVACRMRPIQLMLTFAFASGVALAQPVAGGRGELSFEVASIKPSDPRSTGPRIQFLPGGRLSAAGITIENLICLAFHIRRDQLVGAPGWLDSARYDIEAKPASGTSWSMGQAGMEQQWSRIRSLLIERCSLRVHHALRNAPVYELYVARTGLKIQEAKGSDPKSGDKGAILPWGAFVSDLGQRLGKPVIDKTGLNGSWHIKLQYVTDDGSPAGIGVRVDRSPDAGQSWPSILTALQEQLGLKAVPAKGQVGTLVIDSVSRPASN